MKVIYGNNGGTWMHEDVALEFARWLSPAFAIWCNDRIKELLLNGSVSIDNGVQQPLEAANEKIYNLTAELNYLRGRMEAEKELGALRATIEAEKRIAVLEYRLLKEEKQSPVSQKPKEPVRREIKKRTTEGLFDTPIPKNIITEPD